MTTAEIVEIVAAGFVLIGLAVDTALCESGSNLYFHTLLPLFRRTVVLTGATGPIEEWLVDTDRACRGWFSPIVFRALSMSQVGFHERHRFWDRGIPTLIAGRLRETPGRSVEIVAGPRSFLFLVALGLLSAFPTLEAIGALLACAIVLAGLLYLRLLVVVAALQRGIPTRPADTA
jgi:hypothetical protein